MKSNKYLFTKTHEIDRGKFANLLLAAKGSRTMKDFAEICGANPSTFTRIIQQTNKGASSIALIESIAENADPKSGVTIEALAHANGYTVKLDIGLRSDFISRGPIANSERLVRDVITQSLLDRNQEFSMLNTRYSFSKHLKIIPDVLIKTNAFGRENEVWYIDSLYITGNGVGSRNPGHFAVRHVFERIGRYVLISMNNSEPYKPTRFSLVVFDRVVFDAIAEEFRDTVVPTDISVILLDIMNSVIADEFMLTRIDKGAQKSYFMTTPPISTTNDDYIITDNYDEE